MKQKIKYTCYSHFMYSFIEGVKLMGELFKSDYKIWNGKYDFCDLHFFNSVGHVLAVSSESYLA